MGKKKGTKIIARKNTWRESGRYYRTGRLWEGKETGGGGGVKTTPKHFCGAEGGKN